MACCSFVPCAAVEEDLDRTRRRHAKRVPIRPAESHWQEKRMWLSSCWDAAGADSCVFDGSLVPMSLVVGVFHERGVSQLDAVFKSLVMVDLDS